MDWQLAENKGFTLFYAGSSAQVRRQLERSIEADEQDPVRFAASLEKGVANYVARYEREYLRVHSDWLAQQFKKYLETGLIRKL